MSRKTSPVSPSDPLANPVTDPLANTASPQGAQDMGSATPDMFPEPPSASKPNKTAKPGTAGHRQRLRDRFLKHGPDHMPDYELLEMMLFMAQPRGDTKPLAKTLLAQFGTFADVISAPADKLAAVPGMGDAGIAALKTAQAAAQRLLKGGVADQPVISAWDQLMDYCTAAMARDPVEQFRLLFLDRRNRLIADEVQQRGTVDHTPVYPREVVRRALELHASAVIMVHNHPSGDPRPSRADLEITRKVQEALDAVSIRLHDHVIVSRGGYLSFKSKGHL